MRILLLADIHSNLEALEAVLNAAEKERYDSVWCLGDITGYGPDPAAVIQKMQECPSSLILRGNHDRVVAQIDKPVNFNPHAVVAVFKNMQDISCEQKKWLAELPESLRFDSDVGLFHGSPLDPDEYLLDLRHTEASFREMIKNGPKIAFFGHTHTVRMYEYNQASDNYYDVDITDSTEYELRLEKGGAYLVNPGSVGQPRDGDPRAAFAFLETGAVPKISFRRVPYPIHLCQEKMAEKGYPEILIKRLNLGF